MLDADFIAQAGGALAKALDEANEYIKQNPKQIARLIYEELKVPEAGTLDDIQKFQFDLRLYQKDFDHITSVANWSIENGLIKNQYAIRSFVDIKPLQNALPDRVTVTN